MTTKLWNNQEITSLIACLKRNWDISRVVQEHNKKWKTNRTVDAMSDVLRNRGLGNCSKYLKVPPALPEIKIPGEERIKKLVDYCKYHTSSNMTDLCNHFDCSPKRILDLARQAIEKNYQFNIAKDRLVLTLEAPPVDRLAVHRLTIEPVKDEILVAVASDIHKHSRLHRAECLDDFINTFYHDFGGRIVLHPGDMFAGMRMYPGQFNEVFSLSMEEQLEDAVKTLPKLPGLEWYGIGGNHDESFLKNAGADIMKSLESKRRDFHNLGFYSALVDVGPEKGPNVKVELYHPDKAGAYAISYHLQNAIRDIPPGMKPQIILAGHTHQLIHLPDYRGVDGYYCGTFEEQTLFLKRKHLAPHIGGWILKFGLTKSGALKSGTSTYIKYFHSRRGSIESGGERYEKVMGLPTEE